MPKAVIVIDMNGEAFKKVDPMDQLGEVLMRLAWSINDEGFMPSPTDDEDNECGTATIKED